MAEPVLPRRRALIWPVGPWRSPRATSTRTAAWIWPRPDPTLQGIAIFLRDGQGKLSPLGGGVLPAAGANSMTAAMSPPMTTRIYIVAVPFGVVFLWSRGDGTFTPLETLPLGSNPVVVETADLDQDGDLDLATANVLNSRLQRQRLGAAQRGRKGFALPRNYGVGSGFALLAVADFNGDWRPGPCCRQLAHAGHYPASEQGRRRFCHGREISAAECRGGATSAHPGEKDGAELIVMKLGRGSLGDCSLPQEHRGRIVCRDGFLEPPGAARLRGHWRLRGRRRHGVDGGRGWRCGRRRQGRPWTLDEIRLAQGDLASGRIGGLERNGRLDLALGAEGKVSIYVNETPPARSRDTNRNGLPDECESRPFHRGDPNADGKTDLSDAVAILEFLFLDGVTPGVRNRPTCRMTLSWI